MHPVHVAREFHRYYGTTIGQFRRKCRIDFAREKLTHSRLPIVEIALECGIHQQPHFTNVFKRDHRDDAKPVQKAPRDDRTEYSLCCEHATQLRTAIELTYVEALKFSEAAERTRDNSFRVSLIVRRPDRRLAHHMSKRARRIILLMRYHGYVEGAEFVIASIVIGFGPEAHRISFSAWQSLGLGFPLELEVMLARARNGRRRRIEFLGDRSLPS